MSLLARRTQRHTHPPLRRRNLPPPAQALLNPSPPSRPLSLPSLQRAHSRLEILPSRFQTRLRVPGPHHQHQHGALWPTVFTSASQVYVRKRGFIRVRGSMRRRDCRPVLLLLWGGILLLLGRSKLLCGILLLRGGILLPLGRSVLLCGILLLRGSVLLLLLLLLLLRRMRLVGRVCSVGDGEVLVGFLSFVVFVALVGGVGEHFEWVG